MSLLLSEMSIANSQSIYTNIQAGIQCNTGKAQHAHPKAKVNAQVYVNDNNNKI